MNNDIKLSITAEDLYYKANGHNLAVHIKPKGFDLRYACISTNELKSLRAQIGAFKVKGNNMCIIFDTDIQVVTKEDIIDYILLDAQGKLGKLKHNIYISIDRENDDIKILYNYENETFLEEFRNLTDAYLDMFKYPEKEEGK